MSADLPPPQAAAAAPTSPTFIESRIDVGGDSFEYQLLDVDVDLRADLVVTNASRGERSLRLWRQRADATFPAEPDFRMSVPPDVVSWTSLDLRAEPGREILLLTRGGVFSLTTTQPGLQGNLRRELALPLFPDLADPDQLPCHRHVLDVDGDGREELLVMSEGKLVALGVEKNSLRHVFALDCGDRIDEDEQASLSIGGAGVHVRSRAGLQSLFPGMRSSRPTFQDEKLFAERHRFRLPALVDWNGDQRVDAVRFHSRSASVLLRKEDGTFADTPVGFPYVAGSDDEAEENEGKGGKAGRRGSRAQLADCDGDGRTELVLFRDEGGGLSKDSVALIFRREPDGRPTETPTARVKLPGMDVDWELSDVDRDGRMDLLARVIDIPTGLTTLATIRLDVAFLVFRGLPGAALSREPELRFERSFKPEQMARVRETLLTRLDGDFDGDRQSDLVCTQLDGRVEIRRVTRKDGAASGALTLEERPFSSFLPPAPVERMETYDLSNDGVADLTLRHERGIALFVSRPRTSSNPGSGGR